MSEKQWEAQEKTWKKSPYVLIDKRNIFIRWLNKIPKKKILNQGCGIGRYTITLSKMGFNAVGLDFSEKLLKTARINAKKNNSKCKFVKADIRKMPFKNKSFDAVLSPGTIEHVPETEQTVKELSRIIKKNGWLLIHVPHKISVFTFAKALQQFLGIWKLGYEKSFTKKYFETLLESNGFEISDYFLNPLKSGKHKILGGILSLIDKPLYAIGFGGHHMCFLCRRV